MRLLKAGVLALALSGVGLLAPAAALAGIDDATSSTQGASADVLSDPGLLVFGGSQTTTGTTANVEVLQVAGINLLGKTAQNKNTGALAAVGKIVDAVNKGLCHNGPQADGGFCLAVLFTHAQTGTVGSPTGPDPTAGASTALLALTLAKYHLRLLGSSTDTIVSQPGTANQTCTNDATAFIINDQNVISSANQTIGTTSDTTNKPC